MSDKYIFRFRDLGKPEGYTINEHKKIIAKNQFTWWGWWGKSTERFPYTELSVALESNRIDVYFFDSGQSKFYKACLSEVYGYTSGLKKISSPAIQNTPQYYGATELLGWLKIYSIDEVTDPSDVLKSYSYIRLDNLYGQARGDQDEQLFNKIVFSTEELIKQDRTIWKIRPKQSDDFEHEALTKHYQPYNFANVISQKESTTIVWLSDIHFDNGGGKHNFPFQDNNQHKCLATRIEQLINLKEDNNKSAALLISGDITWQSQKEGFDEALRFIKDISSSQGLSPDDIAICPGNHDVGLVTIDEYKLHFGNSGEDNWKRLVSDYHFSQKENYINFYKKCFKLAPEGHLAQGRKFLLDGHKVVEIAAVNSCTLQQVKDTFQGVGFVGESQLQDIAIQMGWKNRKKPKGVTRICMLHHHLTPVNDSEDAFLDFRYSVTLDAERLMQWIVEHEIDYVLHGHMHRNFSTQITRKKLTLEPLTINNPEHSFKIIALGSSGVDTSNLPSADSSNYLCLIDFSEDKPMFNFHKVDKLSNIKGEAEYMVKG